MSLELISDYTAKKAHSEMEAVVQPYERDADLSAHVQSILDDMISDAEADYGIMEQNFIGLFAALPDLPKIIPESIDTNKTTWTLPGTITYAGNQFGVSYDITAELPGEGSDLTYEQLCIDEVLAGIRSAHLKRHPDSSYGDMSNAELESSERSKVPHYVQNALSELSSRIKHQKLNGDAKARTMDSFFELTQLWTRAGTAVTATDLLNTLKPYFSEASIMLLISVSDAQLVNPVDRINSLVGLAKIDELCEQRNRNLEKLCDDASRMTVTATITDGEKTVGTVSAVFSSSEPYLEKLRYLQNNPNSTQYTIRNTRRDAFWDMQSALVAGSVTNAAPGAIARAKRILAHEETVSPEDMAAEVDGYDNQYLQAHARETVEEFLGSVAEDIETLPRDSDTDAVSTQQEVLEYLWATDFGALKPATVSAWQGDHVNLFGKNIPI